MGRFDYVKFDEVTAAKQAEVKAAFETLEGLVEKHVQTGRAKSLVLTKLEEAYMWVGKANRDEQIARNGSVEPQEERGNS